MLASSAGAFTALLYVWYSLRKPDVAMACNGLLGGLVAITGPCAFVSPAAAVLIGVVAGPAGRAGRCRAIETRLRIDDPVGAFAVHGVCGCWGALALGPVRRRHATASAGTASPARCAGCSSATRASSSRS